MTAALECVRKTAESVAPEQIWTQQNSDLITLLRLGAARGQPSTAAWLTRLLELTPAEAKARVRTARLLAGTARH